jgi:crotonobetainyl-CoA:carnitine CoA-transferase CaiB-like acyl-CoA transferase
VRFGGSPIGYGTAAPVLGADTADVLRELGVAEDEVARLAREGTIVVT